MLGIVSLASKRLAKLPTLLVSIHKPASPSSLPLTPLCLYICFHKHILHLHQRIQSKHSILDNFALFAGHGHNLSLFSLGLGTGFPAP